MASPTNYPRAAGLAVVAFVFWSLCDALLKLARDQGVSRGEVLFISGIGGMAVIFLVTALRGKVRNLRPYKPGGVLILSLCQLGGYFCWVAALPYLPLANMYVVAFMTPMAVAIMATLILKERLGYKRAAIIATGFVGVVIAINPCKLAVNGSAWLPYLILFGNMAANALQMFLLRAVAGKEKSECTSFYPRVMIAIGGMALCAATGLPAMRAWVFLIIFASGALGGLGWALLAQAYGNAPAAVVAPFQYLQIVAGALFGYLVWNDIPDAWLFCGAAIIIASGLTLVRHERRASRMLVRAD